MAASELERVLQPYSACLKVDRLGNGSGRESREPRAAMQFEKQLRDRMRRGEITCSVRIWIRPHVKAGGRYALPLGEIEVDAVIPIQLADLTPALSRKSGFTTSTICSQPPSTAVARACSSSTSTTCRQSAGTVIGRRTAGQARRAGRRAPASAPRSARNGQPLVTPPPGACRSGCRPSGHCMGCPPYHVIASTRWRRGGRRRRSWARPCAMPR
jgi:hypothetical protein